MRTFELIVAILVGLALLLVLKAIGLILKFAIIVAFIGMVLGFAVARTFRSRS